MKFFHYYESKSTSSHLNSVHEVLQKDRERDVSIYTKMFLLVHPINVSGFYVLNFNHDI